MNDEIVPEVRLGRTDRATITFGGPLPDGYGGVRLPIRLEAFGLNGESVTAAAVMEFAEWNGGRAALPAFFADLAAAWRGWQGEKTIFDEQVSLSATHDQIRLVTLRVSLVSDGGSPGAWRLVVEVPIEPGSLDAVAAQLRKLIG